MKVFMAKSSINEGLSIATFDYGRVVAMISKPRKFGYPI